VKSAGVTAPGVEEQWLPTAEVGRSRCAITVFGVGGTPLGGRHAYSDVGDDEAHDIVGAAWQRGVRYFDTAPFYGTGESERRMGAALARFPRDSFALSTKTGRYLKPLPAGQTNREGAPFERVLDYSQRGTWTAIEQSLARLGTGRIDIVYIHGVNDADQFHAAMTGTYPVLAKLRDEGTIGAFGAAAGTWEIGRDFVTAGDFDLIMLALRYTLFEHVPALHEFLPLCAAHNVRIAIAAPFSSGISAGAGDTATYNYGPAGDWARRRAAIMAMIATRHGISLAAAALQFPLAHPTVATVVAGSRSGAEVDANLDALSQSIPSEFWDDLREAGLIARQAPVPPNAPGIPRPGARP
jgi:D-threo-aldose 1-dehydrogenase